MTRQKVLYLITILIISLVFVLVNSESTSPLYITREVDSQIFQYIGFAITHGKIPYIDIFDHKGLLIYLIDAIGFKISPSYGICLLQIINLALTIIIWDKLLSLFIDKVVERILIIIVVLLCLYTYYVKGNLTEEWSLLFISYPVLLYYKATKINAGKLLSLELFVIGLCLGIISLLRVNNCAPVLGILFYALFTALRKKEFRYIGKSFCIITLGGLIPIISALAYMYICSGKEGIAEMYYASVTYNLDYLHTFSNDGFTLDKFKKVYKAILPVLFLIPIIKRKKDYVIPVILGLVLTFLTEGKSFFLHYQMIYVPLIVAIFACITKSNYRYTSVIFIALLYGKTLANQFSLDKYTLPREDNSFIAINKIISCIPKSERDSVWVMNCPGMVRDFRKSNFVQMNRMIMPSQMNFSHSLENRECGKIRKQKPKWIIYAEYNNKPYYSWIDSYQEANKDYKFVNDSYIRYNSALWSENVEVYLYRRRN